MPTGSHGLDVALFDNRSLVQACFGLHELILLFERKEDEVAEGPRLTIESSLEVATDHQPAKFYEDLPASAGLVVRLLGGVVQSMEEHADHTLVLRFDNGGYLRVNAIEDGFESYQIAHLDRLHVV